MFSDYNCVVRLKSDHRCKSEVSFGTTTTGALDCLKVPWVVFVRRSLPAFGSSALQLTAAFFVWVCRSAGLAFAKKLHARQRTNPNPNAGRLHKIHVLCSLAQCVFCLFQMPVSPQTLDTERYREIQRDTQKTQRDTEEQRETDRYTEIQRYTERNAERYRAIQSDTDRHRETQRDAGRCRKIRAQFQAVSGTVSGTASGSFRQFLSSFKEIQRDTEQFERHAQRYRETQRDKQRYREAERG